LKYFVYIGKPRNVEHGSSDSVVKNDIWSAKHVLHASSVTFQLIVTQLRKFVQCL